MAMKHKETTTLPECLTDLNGLTTYQVQVRNEHGLTNKSKIKTSKTYLQIICENVFTFFSIVLFAIAAFLIVCSIVFDFDVSITKFGFLGPLLCNIIIGTIQQIRSKNVLEKLNIVTKNKYIAIRNGNHVEVLSDEIVRDDVIELTSGQQIPVDGVLLTGNIEVNESLLTGESDNIFKHINDKVFAGSYVTSGKAVIRVQAVADKTYVSSLQTKMKQINDNKSELMKNIYGIIKMMSVILIFITIITASVLIHKMFKWNELTWNDVVISTATIAVTSIPTGLVLLTSVTLALSVINLSKKKVLVQELYSLEMLSRVNTICLDKTGTLTTGTMTVKSVIKLNNVNNININTYIGSFLSAIGGTNQTSLALLKKFKLNDVYKPELVIPFSSDRKMSIVKFKNGQECMLGAPEYVLDSEYNDYDKLMNIANEEANKGLRVLAFVVNNNPVCFITISDDIRDNAAKTIAYFYENNVDVKIISGDNPVTVAQIAKKCGVKNADKSINMQKVNNDDIEEIVDKFTVFGRISPEQKELVIRALQKKGRKVAMTGDGVNDVLALKAADCAISFNSASDSAKNISDVVLLNDSFDSIPDVVLEGRKVVNNISRTSILFLTKTIFIVF